MFFRFASSKLRKIFLYFIKNITKKVLKTSIKNGRLNIIRENI